MTASPPSQGNFSTNERDALLHSLTPDELALIQRHRQTQFRQDPDTTPTNPIYTASDLLRKELPPIKWVIPNILPEGFGVLAGRPKIGKSWFGLGSGVAVATGGKALGLHSVEAGDVLYLALEDNQRRMQDRLRKVLGLESGGVSPNVSRLHIAHNCPTVDEGAIEFIYAWLRAHSEARLVIIDVIKRIRPRSKGKGSAYDEDYAFIEPLQQLAGEQCVAILGFHHQRKLAADDWLDTLSGTLGLSGAADSLYALIRERGQADATLKGTGRDLTDLDLALRFAPATCTWQIMGNASEYRLSGERAEIIALMRKLDKPVTPKDLYPHLPEKKEEAIRQTMGRMARDEDLILGASGKYIVNTEKHPKPETP